MALAWIRRPAEPAKPAKDERIPDPVVAEPIREPPRAWALFVGENEDELERAARCFLAGLPGTLPVISPPVTPRLPRAVHELPPPDLNGERALLVPRLDRAFPEPVENAATFAAFSPLYLIPKLTQIASEGEPLYVVATAIESELATRGNDVLRQRGLASRFRIVRVSGEPMRRADAPDEVPAPGSALAHLFRASSLLARKEQGEAAEALRQAIALAPDLAAAHYELGKILIRTEDMEGALASFRRVVELLPEFASAWGNLGAALGEIQKLDEASEALHRAVELDPSSHALHSNLGVAERDLGRLEEAEASFRRALGLEPGFVFGHYNLGHVLFLQGRYALAIEAFEKAQALDLSRSPRQALLLALTRLASGDLDGARRDYQSVFSRLEGPMKKDLRTVAEWDLKQLAQRCGVTDALKEAAGLLRALG
jgi:tetratricopeptide (TPR) repeat protein